ncbi:BNR repeat-containing protein [Joostella atrarenae]|uniref:BNR repeat-containing protein n=1 Tax=Joostella atrarenae TaxID=679257 RepID=A0ABS9J531_9FLAO|nr:BNR repeat-containing protein [Joostella atrarenae]MCF8715523.1 BNR repeat-containing protein [Joostella atrarenae]
MIYSQLKGIGKGWSKNSVNAVVFRKNAVTTYKNNQYVAYYDDNGYVTLAKRKLDTDDWEIVTTKYRGIVNDAHRSISIMIDGDGFLHMAWNHHASNLQYVKSNVPEGLTLSNKLDMIGQNELNVTYPEFYKLPNGDLLFLYRDGGSGNGNLVINRYSIAEKRWRRIQDILIDGEGERNAYWQAFIDKLGVIHLSWVWRESPNISTNHDICYARSKDFGETWQKSTGESYELPINLNTAEYAFKIKQNSQLINSTSMFATKEGTPYIATYFSSEKSLVPQFYLLFKKFGTWSMRKVSNRTTPFKLSGGGTKKIPISRPQIVVSEDKKKVYLIYRDIENDNRISIRESLNSNYTKWKSSIITNFSVESWEPIYDAELWKDQEKLHLYVQKVGQGDGEGLESMPAQMVYIYEHIE